MAEALRVEHSVYRQEFDAMQGAPEWQLPLRRHAMEAFEARGFPTRREEAWRRTNLAAVTADHFRRADGGSVTAADLEQLRALGDGHRVVFVNGAFAPELSDLEALPSGLTLTPLGAYESTPAARLEACYGQLADAAANPFVALNTALSRDGLFLHLGAGSRVERPVQVVHLTTADAGGQAVYPRLVASVESGAELTLVEHYLGGGEAPALVVPVTELAAEAGAIVDYYRVQEIAAGNRHIGVASISAGRDARVRAFTFARGGALTRLDLHADLRDTGADVTLNGLYLTAGREFCDHHTWVTHQQPHGTSRQLFKGVLQGRSETVFDGLVKVCEGAQKTDAQQQNRNLLLERMALAHSNPRLEIHADDVKCAHGSTVGQLDDDALFYLRSRGIGREDAEGLLTLAFASELISAVRPAGLADYLRRRLLDALPGDDTLRDSI